MNLFSLFRPVISQSPKNAFYILVRTDTMHGIRPDCMFIKDYGINYESISKTISITATFTDTEIEAKKYSNVKLAEALAKKLGDSVVMDIRNLRGFINGRKFGF